METMLSDDAPSFIIERGQESAEDQNNLNYCVVLNIRRIQIQLPFESKPKPKYYTGHNHMHCCTKQWTVVEMELVVRR